MSAARARQNPPPMAAPFTAAMTGWCSRRMVAMTSSSISMERRAMVGRVRPSMLGMVPGFSWSAPEQKPRPAPVMTTTRTALSLPISRSASRKGIMTSKAMAFMRSGRLSVTTATPGCGRVISVKDMRGIVETRRPARTRVVLAVVPPAWSCDRRSRLGPPCGRSSAAGPPGRPSRRRRRSRR